MRHQNRIYAHGALKDENTEYDLPRFKAIRNTQLQKVDSYLVILLSSIHGIS